MSAQPIVVRRAGLVTSVGLSAPAACAAIRGKLTNPSETRFNDNLGEPIVSHTVPLPRAWRGLHRLAHMAAMVVVECLADVPREAWVRLPLLLCVAERTRPGRLDGLDERLTAEIGAVLGGAQFSSQSGVIAHGRVGVAVALVHARKLLYESLAPAVLIVAADGLLLWPTLRVLDEQQRLLTSRNPNGFIAGEAASGVVVSRTADGPHLRITGLGFATESATVDNDVPLRGLGLSAAIEQALRDASVELHHLDFRITDVSGEQFYFKEASLAMSRSMRQYKEAFDIWHPAECIGEVGSAIGPAMLAVADAAGRKGYAPGPSMLLHAANDDGRRAAIVARYMVS